jgi:hypothetical protein
MEDKIRVLVADNFPRWETRYLLNIFKRDDRIAFEQMVFEPQPGAGAGARAVFPATLEEWSKYRIVILGDVLPTQLTPDRQRVLREYITEGGGNLIIIAPCCLWNPETARCRRRIRFTCISRTKDRCRSRRRSLRIPG